MVDGGDKRELLLISGMSGAGKGTASKVLEEFGWYVVDNLPLSFMSDFLERISESETGPQRLAMVVDLSLIHI